MALNLRGEKANEYKELSNLYKARKEKVEKRKQLESEISKDNSYLVKRFTDVLKPLCNRAGYGIHMAICDRNVEFSTEIGLKFKRGAAGARLTILQDKIENWTTSSGQVKKQLRTLEKSMRLFKKIIKESDVTIRPPSMVVVSIQTRNRYF